MPGIPLARPGTLIIPIRYTITGIACIEHPELAIEGHDLQAFPPEIIKTPGLAGWTFRLHLPAVSVLGSEVVIPGLFNPAHFLVVSEVHNPGVVFSIVENDP